MPLIFDTTKPVDTEERRTHLVHAIAESKDKNGERHWIEWKRHVNLKSEVKAELTLAQEILAMANRDVRRSAADCQGWGYIVVGVDHEGIHGIEALSTSQLEQKLAPYLGQGSDAPTWEPVNIEVDGLNVLIIGVRPPEFGDPIFTLRRKPGNAEEGTVFARTIEKSQRADPDQMRMLQFRLLDGSFADVLMERLSLVGLTLSADVSFGEKLPAWRPFALVTSSVSEYSPTTTVVHPVPRGYSFRESLDEGFNPFAQPMWCDHWLVVHPSGTDLDASMGTMLHDFPQLLAEGVDNGPPQRLVAVCHGDFGELHQAIQLLLRAGPGGGIPMARATRALRIREGVRGSLHGDG